MGASEELEYLKSLVSQLNEKITALEAKAKSPPSPKLPARQLRTILIGPPGAGTYCRKPRKTFLRFRHKVRVHKRLGYATTSASATWQLEICCVIKSRRKHP